MTGWSQVDRAFLAEQQQKMHFLLKDRGNNEHFQTLLVNTRVKVLQRSNSVIISVSMNNKQCDTGEQYSFSINYYMELRREISQVVCCIHSSFHEV